MVKSDDSKLSLDEIYMQIGFGKFHIVIMIVLGLIWMYYAVEVVFLSFIGPILVCVWKISLWKSSFVTISFFFGMGIGTLIFGKWGDIYGRKPMLIMCMCVDLYFSLLNATSPTLIWMIITKCFVGFFSGGVILLVSTMLTEIMPINHRGSVMVSMQIFSSLGSIYVTFSTYELTESVGWRYSLIILISYMVIMTILAIFLPESPRYLLLNNGKSEALKIINKIASMNRVEHITNVEINHIKKSSFADLFHKNYFRTTLILFYIFFAAGLDYMGFTLLSPLIYSIPRKCLQGSVQNSNSSSMENTLSDNSCCISLSWNATKPMLISTIGEICSTVLCVYLVTFISRKLLMQILLAMIALAYLLINLCVSPIYMGIILLFGRGAALSFFGVIYLYALEVLPTSVRGRGVGLSSSFVRIGLILSSITVNIIMVQVSFMLGSIIMISVNIVGCLLIFALPYETKDRALLETVYDDIDKLMM